MLLDPDISQPKRAKSMSIHGTEHSGNENLNTGAQFRYLAFSLFQLVMPLLSLILGMVVSVKRIGLPVEWIGFEQQWVGHLDTFDRGRGLFSLLQKPLFNC